MADPNKMTEDAPMQDADTRNDDLGVYPELCELPVGQLRVDDTYQRDLGGKRSQQLIARIVENFAWPKFGVVIATPWPEKSTGGKPVWAVIDGQHRTEAARRRGIAQVPALVYEGLSVSEAAAVFTGVNRDRVTVHPMGLHHAMVAAGDPAALKIENVCRASGVEITRYPVQARDMKPGQTMAVASIRRALGAHGEEALKTALKVLSEAFENEPGRIRANLITGAAEWVARSQESGLTGECLGRVRIWLEARTHNVILDEIADERDATGDPAQMCLVRLLMRAAGQVTPDASAALEQAVSRTPSTALRVVVNDPPAEVQLGVEVNRQCSRCRTYFRTRSVSAQRCETCLETLGLTTDGETRHDA